MESRDERERRAQTNERDERQRRESRDKIFLFFLQYSYSAILKIELHCSKYYKKFTILAFTIF